MHDAPGEMIDIGASIRAAAMAAPTQCLHQIAEPAAAPQAAVPVAGQSRMFGGDWGSCSVEHVAMVLAAPNEWKEYEVRYLYAAPAHPAEGVPAAAALRDAETLLRKEAARLERMYGMSNWYGFCAEKAAHLEHIRVADTIAATPAAGDAGLKQFLGAAKDADITHLPKSFGKALREHIEAAGAPAVMPEPDVWGKQSAIEWLASEQCSSSGYCQTFLHKSKCQEADVALYTADTVRALLAGVSAPAADPIQAAADAASVGHLSHLVDHQTALLTRAMATMKAVEHTATPIDESHGDMDARIPYEAWAMFVDSRAALLHDVAQSPVAAPQAQAQAAPAAQEGQDAAEDDGCALRLAVERMLILSTHTSEAWAQLTVKMPIVDNDPCAAMRRAIVCADAAIAAQAAQGGA